MFTIRKEAFFVFLLWFFQSFFKETFSVRSILNLKLVISKCEADGGITSNNTKWNQDH